MSVKITEVEYICPQCKRRRVLRLADKAHPQMFLACVCGRHLVYVGIVKEVKGHKNGGRHG